MIVFEQPTDWTSIALVLLFGWRVYALGRLAKRPKP